MPSTRSRMIAAVSAAAASGALTFMGGTGAAQAAPAAPAASAAQAQLEVNVWRTYGSGGSLAANMAACQVVSTACFGLQDGQVLGLLDPLAVIDELDQALGVPYNDTGDLPAPESASNPVVQVWNGAGIELFVGPGASAAQDVQNNGPIYGVATGTDPSGTPVDAWYGYDSYSGQDAAGAGGTIKSFDRGYGYY